MSDEMKINNPIDLSKKMVQIVLKEMAIMKTLFIMHTRFYNMKSTDSLTILSNFKTLQQSSEWSCGVDSALMVLNYYDKLGSYTEESLCEFSYK